MSFREQADVNQRRRVTRLLVIDGHLQAIDSVRLPHDNGNPDRREIVGGSSWLPNGPTIRSATSSTAWTPISSRSSFRGPRPTIAKT